MFDIGWTEMMVVAVVAILFVGPRELPGMLRTLGRSVKKLRTMAGEFQKQFDDALKEAEFDEVKNTLNEVRNLNPASKIKDHLNPIKEDLQEAKKLVEEAGEFDPDKDFDEPKLPDPPEPVKVDVDAALERQRKADEIKKVELAAEAEQAAVKKRAAKKSAAKTSASKSGSPPRTRSKTAAIGAKSKSGTGKSGTTARTSAKRQSTSAKQPTAKTVSSRASAKSGPDKTAKKKTSARKASAKAKSTEKAGA